MKIDLTNIPSEGKKADFRLTPDWWRPDPDEDRIVGLEGPLSAWIKIYPAGKKIVVEGFLSTRLLLRCDRCLEPYSWDLSTDFRIYLSISPFKGELEVELSEDDLDLDFIDGNLLDPDQIIKEQIILNVPVKTLCTRECKGLCPICGCNLNMTRCSCSLRDKKSFH
ncbi:MAG: DUF177 domain-containing protein [Deltaproteobacteria bacterium]|jgi:uncharacterized protein|nr:MAG: DUF177 domain-containing protein [Deltaproteobacteria bacterium]